MLYRGYVSIPYTRVTNYYEFYSQIGWRKSFNPLYTGHQPVTIQVYEKPEEGFNPLYTGHQLCGNLHIFVHKVVSIPYTRVTNLVQLNLKKGNILVSIPYTRVTNSRSNIYMGRCTLQFQSPIHGSPTRLYAQKNY